MKQILLHTLALCGSLLVLAGCSTEELATAPISGKSATLVATIGSNTNTRTGHEEDAPNGVGVKVTWIANDVINIYSGTPLANNTPVAFVCESIDGTTGAGTFGSEQIPVIGKPYFALYPATLTHELKLSMLGQTQASNKSMAHLSAYDAMCTQTDDWKTVDFTAASPSESSTSAHLASLITFDLQNLPATLGKPTKITLGCIDGSGNAAAVFQETLNGDDSSKTSTLSLSLGDGFTDITDEDNSIKAYLMVAPATIPVGYQLTIAVACSDNTYLFTSKAVEAEIKYEAGKRHTAAVKEAFSWEKPFSGSTYTGIAAAEAFTGGGSSAADPYLIGSAGQLRTLIEGTKVSVNNGYKGKYFKLTTDIRIAMANGNNWIPIGDNDNKFKGTFDGNGHTISGTMMGTVDNFGFFGYTSGATISNLTVDATVSGSEWYVGGIVGYASTTRISNCTNKRAVTGTYNRVGGIAGYAGFCTISNCTNKGAVTSKFGEVGGIVGFANSGSIIACYNTATVTASSITSSTHSGGIAGKLEFGSVVTACYNTGRIIIVENSIGAITGENPEGCTVSCCQWVLDAANGGLSAFPSGGSTTSKENNERDLTALNDAGVTALNVGIAAWNATNAAGTAKHCPFHFVAGTAGTGPTLAAGAPE